MKSDGSEQHFTVAFASLPVLQREGRFKYAVTGGQYRSYNSDVEKPRLLSSPAFMACRMV